MPRGSTIHTHAQLSQHATLTHRKLSGFDVQITLLDKTMYTATATVFFPHSAFSK